MSPGALFAGWMVMWGWLCVRALNLLSERPFDAYQSAHIALRMQVRLPAVHAGCCGPPAVEILQPAASQLAVLMTQRCAWKAPA